MSDPPDLVRHKAQLRARLLERRRLEGDSAAAQAVAARLGAELTLPPGVVAGYWPLAGELDPRPAMMHLAAAGHRLALPRMRGPAEPLAFHAWRPGETLIRGRFRVMEPAPTAPAAVPRVVLVPLVGFDRAGHRLGHGAGYYDRTLRALRREGRALLAIGLAFAAQEVDEVPVGAADELLDAVATERATHRVGPGAGAPLPAGPPG